MNVGRLYPGLLIVLVVGLNLRADPLPVVGPIPVEQLRTHARHITDTLADLKGPRPAEKELRALLATEPDDAVEFSRKVQSLLDAHCLVGVAINPESRVKAARGLADARLVAGRESVFLIKVHNEGGVTSGIAVSGPGVRGSEPDGWLTATVVPVVPKAKGLGGAPLEYVLLKLKPSETGKREATLRFDVGQGTQDLGFRAEVAILFTVAAP